MRKILLALAVCLGLTSWSDGLGTVRAEEPEPNCKLILRGEPIVVLVFDWYSPVNYQTYTKQGFSSNEKGQYKKYQLALPKGTIKLPPGGCEIKKLILKNGLECYRPSFRFEVTAETPFELVIEDLACKVTAERIGPFLSFDFVDTTDSQGRTYRSNNQKVEPHYSVSYQGKQITSGTLEYG